MPGPYFANQPEFMPSLHEWGRDRSQRAPDPRKVGLGDSDMFDIIMNMVGPEGYMEYLAALKKQRDKAGTPAPTPSPTMTPTPTPRPSDIDAGIEAINERRRLGY